MKNAPDSILLWERERSRLSHDTLKNEMIPMVSKAIHVMEGKVRDKTFESALPLQILDLGSQMCQGVSSILKSVSIRLSPARYLEMDPLVQMDEDTKQWLADVVDAAWKDSIPIDRLVEEAHSQEVYIRERLQTLDDWSSKSQDCRKVLLRELLCEVRELSHKLAGLKTLLPYPI